MKTKIILSLFLILTMASSALFSSSAGNIDQDMPALLSKQEALVVQIKSYDSEESKFFLDKDLLSRGVQPIQILIHNNTANIFYIPYQATNLRTISPKKIAFRISKSAIPRAIGYKIASLFFWPLIIPSTIDSIRTHKKYRAMSKEFSEKSLKEETIPRYSIVNRIVFVKKEDDQEPLTITLIDQRTQQPLTFQA